MRFFASILLSASLLALLFTPSRPLRAEIVEEVVAWVNGEIITKTELETEEQAVIAEAYRRFTGEELDGKVAEIRKGLLSQLIDRKILLDYAKRLYDVDKMGDVFYESFREQQGIPDDDEFERLLAQQGMTPADMRKRLIENFAPDEVIRAEVSTRISVADKEIDLFYEENKDKLNQPAEATLREIILLADSDSKKEERRAEAESIRRRALTETFTDLVTEVSEAGTKETGGLLGPLKQGDLSAVLDNVAFTLPVGEVSEVLEEPYGFHILKVESRREEGAQPLDEVRDQLRGVIEQDKYVEGLTAFMEKARAEAEWCVKKKYQDRSDLDASKMTCRDL